MVDLKTIFPDLSEEIDSLLLSSTSDTSEFASRYSGFLKDYKEQLQEGSITISQFKGYVEHLFVLMEMEAAKKEVSMKLKANEFREKAALLFLNKLMPLLLSLV